jgi:hypothetical protein
MELENTKIRMRQGTFFIAGVLPGKNKINP